MTTLSRRVAVAQTPPDTTSQPAQGAFFTYRDALIFGGFAAGTIVFAHFDNRLAEFLQTRRANESQFVHDAAAGFRSMGEPGPQIIGISMYGIGKLARWKRVEKLGLHGLEAIVLSVFVLLSQNRQAAKEHIRGDIEYDVNLKAELEVAHLHEKVDRLAAEVAARLARIQNTLDREIAG